MSGPIDAQALDQIFLSGRSIHRFLPRAVDDDTLRQLHDLVKLGPTGFNSQPARFLFIRSEKAKRQLAPALSSSNREKTLAAPLNVVVAWDRRFHDHLPTQFPAYDARGFFEANPEWIESSGVSNAYLQAAYLIIAARALGLDAGPMTGFTASEVDQAFFSDSPYRSLLVINLGYGDRSQLRERGPRLGFEEVVSIL